MTEAYDFHLNFKALHKSTNELEFLLNKYRSESKYVEEVYQGLKPLFDKIKANLLKKAIEGNLSVSRMLGESGIEDQYPDLSEAYAKFSHDVHGRTDDPYNDELSARIRKAQQEELARRAALKEN